MRGYEDLIDHGQVFAILVGKLAAQIVLDLDATDDLLHGHIDVTADAGRGRNPAACADSGSSRCLEELGGSIYLSPNWA